MSGELVSLILCDTCGGTGKDLIDGDDACDDCEGSGVLDQDRNPFDPPAPFDKWTAAQLVTLSQSSNERAAMVAVPDAPRRLRSSDIIERLLLALSRGGQDHSTIELARNAKGDTQIRVSVRTGEAGIDTIEQARMKAEETYDHLRKLYPMGQS